MFMFWVDLIYALMMAGAGAAAGWWLRSRTPSAAADTDSRRAREVLTSLQQLATHVAAELGQHSSRVEEINEELTSTKARDSAGIVQIVTRLVDTNRTMQGRLEQAEDKLRQQAQLVQSHAAEARTDALTLIGNRRAFDAAIAERYAEFKRGGKPFALAMLDLDKFKRFNDTYGHQAGDEVLRGMGRILGRIARENDLAARFGGEEFALLMPNTLPQEARQIVAQIRKNVEKAAISFEGQTLQVTVSLGLAQIRRGEDVAGLIKRADEALYASKDAGRNCAHWHDGQEAVAINADGALALRQSPAAKPAAAETPKASFRPAAPVEAKQPEPEPETDMTPYDPTTDLLNRTVFCQHVRARMAEWKRGGPSLALILIEIDQHQHLAEMHGPWARERAVGMLARLVQATVREMDLVAQYSPSCLAFLLPGARLLDAARVAERLRELAGKQPLIVGQTSVTITVSVGVIEVTEKDDLVSLFKRAESALETSQMRGGNCTCHSDGHRCLPAVFLPELVGPETVLGEAF